MVPDSFVPAYLPWAGPAQASDAPCVRDTDRALTYRELSEEAFVVAQQLRERGVGSGDVVAVMLPNSIELLVTILASWILGAAATPINPTFTAREASYQVADSGAKLLVAATSGMADIPTIERADLRRAGEQATPVALHPHDLALLVYTSGSTGQPKGVMLDHANFVAMSGQMAQHFSLTSDDHALLVLPMFHVNSLLVTFLTPLTVGAQVTVLERFAPAAFVDALNAYQPTYFSGVPTIFAHLVSLPDETVMHTERLRFAVCGAAPATPELLARAEGRFGMSIVEGYGLTESTCASACNPVDGVRKAGTVGPALEGQQIRIVAEDGSEVPQGERGEIVIAGPTIMRGYLGKPEATASTIRDGWLHTGDIGVLDADGYLRIVDRIKDMIIRGGENLYPKEIEEFLATHPAVLEAAVVGKPHESLGEVPVAQVVLAPGHDGVTGADLQAHCAGGLTKIKIPVSIDIVAALPRNPVGKIDKPAMRRALADAL